MQKNPNRLICHPVEKTCKCIKDLNIQPDTWNLTEMKVWHSVEVIDTGKDFLNQAMITQAIRPIIKQDTVKLESFCMAKNTVIQANRQPIKWKNIFINFTSDKRLIHKIFNKL